MRSMEQKYSTNAVSAGSTARISSREMLDRNLQACFICFRNGGFFHRPHQVRSRANARLLLELLDAFLRTLFWPQLFAFNQVVVPVQLFAKVPDRAHQFALPGSAADGTCTG